MMTRDVDSEASRTWQYPTNYSVRQYQLDICRQALFSNTLVCLPTGLGKTLIAAVVMHNYYRWFPEGKIIFMAPTRPLVSQQCEACIHILSLPPEVCTVLDGHTPAPQRANHYQTHNLIFCTPQTVQNDLDNGILDGRLVVCVCVDEAHRATANYAYTCIIAHLAQRQQPFRVLALTATPGGEMKRIQQVITNLRISHIEVRSESHPSLAPYLPGRGMTTLPSPLYLSPASFLSSRFSPLLDRLREELVVRGIWQGGGDVFGVWGRVLDEMRRAAGTNLFTVSILSLYSTLLDLHKCLSVGIKTDKNQLSAHVQEIRRICIGGDLRGWEGVYEEVCRIARAGLQVFTQPSYYLPLYSKLGVLVTYITSIFQSSSSSTPTLTAPPKLLIFASLRSTVKHILLALRDIPGVKARGFVGQGKGAAAAGEDGGGDFKANSQGNALGSKATDEYGYDDDCGNDNGDGSDPYTYLTQGMSQPQQLEVLSLFRTGQDVNTLVCTSIGEEGLDIGGVGVVICFDTPLSPIRYVQRIGRTGRSGKPGEGGGGLGERGQVVVISYGGQEKKEMDGGVGGTEELVSEGEDAEEGRMGLDLGPSAFDDETEGDTTSSFISSSTLSLYKNLRGVMGKASSNGGAGVKPAANEGEKVEQSQSRIRDIYEKLSAATPLLHLFPHDSPLVVGGRGGVLPELELVCFGGEGEEMEVLAHTPPLSSSASVKPARLPPPPRPPTANPTSASSLSTYPAGSTRGRGKVLSWGGKGGKVGLEVGDGLGKDYDTSQRQSGSGIIAGAGRINSADIRGTMSGTMSGNTGSVGVIDLTADEDDEDRALFSFNIVPVRAASGQNSSSLSLAAPTTYRQKVVTNPLSPIIVTQNHSTPKASSPLVPHMPTSQPPSYSVCQTLSGSEPPTLASSSFHNMELGADNDVGFCYDLPPSPSPPISSIVPDGGQGTALYTDPHIFDSQPLAVSLPAYPPPQNHDDRASSISQLSLSSMGTNSTPNSNPTPSPTSNPNTSTNGSTGANLPPNAAPITSTSSTTNSTRIPTPLSGLMSTTHRPSNSVPTTSVSSSSSNQAALPPPSQPRLGVRGRVRVVNSSAKRGEDNDDDFFAPEGNEVEETKGLSVSTTSNESNFLSTLVQDPVPPSAPLLPPPLPRPSSITLPPPAPHIRITAVAKAPSVAISAAAPVVVGSNPPNKVLLGTAKVVAMAGKGVTKGVPVFTRIAKAAPLALPAVASAPISSTPIPTLTLSPALNERHDVGNHGKGGGALEQDEEEEMVFTQLPNHQKAQRSSPIRIQARPISSSASAFASSPLNPSPAPQSGKDRKVGIDDIFPPTPPSPLIPSSSQNVLTNTGEKESEAWWKSSTDLGGRSSLGDEEEDLMVIPKTRKRLRSNREEIKKMQVKKLIKKRVYSVLLDEEAEESDDGAGGGSSEDEEEEDSDELLSGDFVQADDEITYSPSFPRRSSDKDVRGAGGESQPTPSPNPTPTSPAYGVSPGFYFQMNAQMSDMFSQQAPGVGVGIGGRSVDIYDLVNPTHRRRREARGGKIGPAEDVFSSEGEWAEEEAEEEEEGSEEEDSVPTPKPSSLLATVKQRGNVKGTVRPHPPMSSRPIDLTDTPQKGLGVVPEDKSRRPPLHPRAPSLPLAKSGNVKNSFKQLLGLGGAVNNHSSGKSGKKKREDDEEEEWNV